LNCGECDQIKENRKKKSHWYSDISNCHLSAYMPHKWQLHVCAPCTGLVHWEHQLLTFLSLAALSKLLKQRIISDYEW